MRSGFLASVPPSNARTMAHVQAPEKEGLGRRVPKYKKGASLPPLCAGSHWHGEASSGRLIGWFG